MAHPPTSRLFLGPFRSTHAGPKDMRLTESIRDKKIVWTHKDEAKPGIHHFQILDTVEGGRRRRSRRCGGEKAVCRVTAKASGGRQSPDSFGPDRAAARK